MTRISTMKKFSQSIIFFIAWILFSAGDATSAEKKDENLAIHPAGGPKIGLVLSGGMNGLPGECCH